LFFPAEKSENRLPETNAAQPASLATSSAQITTNQ